MINTILAAVLLANPCMAPVHKVHHHTKLPEAPLQSCVVLPPTVFAMPAPEPEVQPLPAVHQYFVDAPVVPVAPRAPWVDSNDDVFAGFGGMDFGGFGGGGGGLSQSKTVYNSYSSSVTNITYSSIMTNLTDLTVNNTTVLNEYNYTKIVNNPPRHAHAAPEIDATAAGAGLTFLAGLFLVVTDRRRNP